MLGFVHTLPMCIYPCRWGCYDTSWGTILRCIDTTKIGRWFVRET